MALLTTTDVSDALARIFDDREYRLAQATIAGIEGALALYLRRPLETDTYTDTITAPPGSRNIFCRNTPVATVATVTVDGTTIDPTMYWRRGWGVELRRPLADTASVTVAYDGGLEPEHAPQLRHILLRAVVREMQRTLDGVAAVTDISIEGVSYHLTAPEDIFTASELRLCGHLRCRGGA